MGMDQEAMKEAVAQAAIDQIRTSLKSDSVIGVGTGSTANCFIDALAPLKSAFEGAVASSEASAERLRARGIQVLDLNSVDRLEFYIDGADEFNERLELIKGGGGALTREKIVAAVARTFLCIVDESKKVDLLGAFPLAVEVIPMARSHVAREVFKMGAQPVYRQGFTTDNGNLILDIHNFEIDAPRALEEQLNNIPGVVCNGLFALRPADLVLMGCAQGVKILEA